jgi:hypothetical protein
VKEYDNKKKQSATLRAEKVITGLKHNAASGIM